MKDEYIRRVEIDRVVDGDTVDAMVDLGYDTWVFHRFRLEGIDAPETRTRDLEEKAKGITSKDYLIMRLQQGEVTVKSLSTGKYGRYLGTFFVDGVNINDEMVDLGLAKVYE